MGRIETLIILPVASFHLPVVAWGKGADEFVADPVEFQMFLEQGRLFVARGKTVGKLCAIISLNAFDWTREGLYQMFYKLGGRIGAVLLKCFHKTPAGVLVNGRVLEKLFSNDLRIFQAGRGNKFHINLNPLSGIIHRFIGLRDVLWIGWMYRHDSLFSEKTIKSGNGTGIAALP